LPGGGLIKRPKKERDGGGRRGELVQKETRPLQRRKRGTVWTKRGSPLFALTELNNNTEERQIPRGP